MKRYLSIFLSSIFSGILISIGGMVYLSSKNYSPILASFLFAFGLFTIITLNLHLYTGKIGYLFENKKQYLLDLVICLFGNALASISTGYLLYGISHKDERFLTMIHNANSLCQIKSSSSWLSILVLSFFCGVMIFLAVELSKRDLHAIFKVIAIFLSVAIFILCGFEHCIANMFYYSLANMWDLKSIGYILLTIIGNSLGSLFLYALLYFSNQTKKDFLK